MTDREKVINGMECCAVGAECDHCPYSQLNDGGYQGCYQMHQDALALLKAQEPRVMTVEEVIESEVGTVVWLEDIDKPTVITGLVDRVFTGTMVVDFQCVAKTVTAGFDDYGKRWRCWTSRPTDAQREAEPWTSLGRANTGP